MEYRFTVMPFNQALSLDQQWVFDNKNRIVHSSSGMCLTLGYIDVPADEVMEQIAFLAQMYGSPIETKTRAWLKLEKCSEKNDENEKWSFESILNEGVYKCANYSSLPTI